MDAGFLQRINQFKFDKDLTYKQIGAAIGVSEYTATNYFNGRTQMPLVKLLQFCDAFDGDINTLLGVEIDVRSTDPAIVTAYSSKGGGSGFADTHRLIPFFDVDVMATPIEVFNDQTTRPAYTIDMPGFQDCDFAIKVYGHSMYPTIESGMIVLCKKVVDMEIIAYGEIYLVVTADLRMVKRLIRSDKPDHVLATSDNHNGHASPDGKTYPPIEIPLKKILHLYLVKGSFKRHMI